MRFYDHYIQVNQNVMVIIVATDCPTNTVCTLFTATHY